MGRRENRAARELEKNPIVELNKIRDKFYPELMDMFSLANDPRNQSYITYSIQEMLAELFYMNVTGIESMQQMDQYFNDPVLVKNFYDFCGTPHKEFLPHHETQNEFLEKLDSGVLETIRRDIIRKLIRRKTFNEARVLGKWLIIVDGVELDEGKQKKNDGYLQRRYNKGTEKEIVKYHRSMLEAKLSIGNNEVISICSEPIANDPDYEELKLSDEKIKQDSEQKAFIRLAKKLKDEYPRMSICICADALYVSENVLEQCKGYGWDYIIRYKAGAAPTIEEEYENIPEKEHAGENTEFINDIVYHEGTVNVLKHKERKKKKKKGIIEETDFAWITSFKITRKKAKELVSAGRKRWKIENQGFNKQKHWEGNLEHAYSWNENAQINHYLMLQIADLFRTLYEIYYLQKHGIEKKKKNIPSDLLRNFAQNLAREGIPNKNKGANVFALS